MHCRGTKTQTSLLKCADSSESMLIVYTYSQGGGGGYSEICIIRRLGLFLRFKFLNFNIFGGFQKNEYFLGMKILWIFLEGHHKIGLYLGVISMHFRVFS